MYTLPVKQLGFLKCRAVSLEEEIEVLFKLLQVPALHIKEAILNLVFITIKRYHKNCECLVELTLPV